MNHDDFERTARAWLEDGPTQMTDRALSAALDDIHATPQRRARRPAWRLTTMITPFRLAGAAAAIGVLAVVGGIVPRASGPAGNNLAASLSPSPSAAGGTPAPWHQGSLAAGDYMVTPFADYLWAPCGPAEYPCAEATRDDAIRFTVTVPDGWAGTPLGGADIWLAVEHNSAPDGAGFLIGRGGWLYSEPCSDRANQDVPVGPTVDDFVAALVSHPLLEVTDPIETMLSGYPGRYLEIQVPADITDCPYYQVWEPTFYAQGASNLWPIWVLDVDGVRVVVHGSQFPGTAPERVAELRAIVESLRIDHAPAESAAPSPGPRRPSPEAGRPLSPDSP